MPPPPCNPAAHERSYILMGAMESDPPDGKDHPPKQSSMRVTVFHFLNYIAGTGVMSIPYALREAGLGLGLPLLVSLAVLIRQSLVLQVEAGRAMGATTYQEAVEGAFGTPGFVLCALLQFFFSYFALVGDQIIIGDTLTKVIIRAAHVDPSSFFVRREFVSGLVTLFVLLPLTSVRNISNLGFVSLAAVALVSFFSIVMMVRAPAMMQLARGSGLSLSPRLVGPNVGSAIGIICMTFVCHHTTYALYRTLRDNSTRRWAKVTNISISLALIICSVGGLAGYLPFTDLAQGDIMENYCWHDDLLNICRGLLALSVMFTFPLDCFGARDVLETSFFRNVDHEPRWRHLLLTLLIVLSSFGVALISDCLADVMNFTGIFVACPMAFFLPGATFIKATGGPLFSKENAPAWAVIILGVILSFTGLIMLVINWASIGQCSHGVEMEYCYVMINGTRTPVEL